MVQCVWRLSCSACDNLLITILSFFFSPSLTPTSPLPFLLTLDFLTSGENHKELVRSLTFHLLFSGVCCDGQLFFCPFVSTKSFIYLAPPQLTTFSHLTSHCNDTAPNSCPRSLRHCGGATGGLKCSAHLSPGPHPQRAPQGCSVRQPSWPRTHFYIRNSEVKALSIPLTVHNLWNSPFCLFTFLIPPLPYF